MVKAPQLHDVQYYDYMISIMLQTMDRFTLLEWYHVFCQLLPFWHIFDQLLSFLSLQGVADDALDHAANPVAAAPQPEVSMEIQQLGDQNKGTESTNISDT